MNTSTRYELGYPSTGAYAFFELKPFTKKREKPPKPKHSVKFTSRIRNYISSLVSIVFSRKYTNVSEQTRFGRSTESSRPLWRNPSNDERTRYTSSDFDSIISRTSLQIWSTEVYSVLFFKKKKPTHFHKDTLLEGSETCPTRKTGRAREVGSESRISNEFKDGVNHVPDGEVIARAYTSRRRGERRISTINLRDGRRTNGVTV